jgi:hypothetical protein
MTPIEPKTARGRHAALRAPSAPCIFDRLGSVGVISPKHSKNLMCDCCGADWTDILLSPIAVRVDQLARKMIFETACEEWLVYKVLSNRAIREQQLVQ